MVIRVLQFLRDENGEDLIEYGLLAAFVAAVGLAVIINDPLGLRQAVVNAYQAAVNALNSQTAVMPGMGFWVGAMMVAAVGAWTDARSRRIPNWLTMPAVGIGVVTHWVAHGSAGLTSALGGMGIAIVLLMPGYLQRLMGAGDVKLMTAVAAILGFGIGVVAVLASVVAGGLIAMATAMRHRAVVQTVHGAARLGGWIAARVANPHVPAPATLDLRAPFGLAIFAGTAFAVGYALWR